MQSNIGSAPGSPKRSEAFHPAHEPLRHDPALNLQQDRVSGPLPFLNPTKAHFQYEARPDVRFKWSSRNNRKGRHAMVVGQAQATASSKQLTTPRPTSSFNIIVHGVCRMLTYYPVWDVSFDVAFVFTIGSVIWVINAFLVWLPLIQPDSEFADEELYGGGITAFVGATVFEFGSLLLMAEAVNENKSGCFGWALEQALSRKGGDDETRVRKLEPSKSHCTHHHLNKRNLVGKGNRHLSKEEPASVARSWVWWPSTTDLKTHYIYNLGFLASFFQLCGATVFWISGLTALPGIYNKMSRPIAIIFYWTPQVIGGLGFIISGTLFMLETQSKWWKPAPRTLGWWIGAWNLIGGIGFTICPAFGYDTSSWSQYQACLSTFWGSWAFLIGSVVQWYECLEKFPVEVEKSKKDSVAATDGM